MHDTHKNYMNNQNSNKNNKFKNKNNYENNYENENSNITDITDITDNTKKTKNNFNKPNFVKLNLKMFHFFLVFIITISVFSALADSNFYQYEVLPTLQKSMDNRSVQIFSLGLASTLVARNQDDSVRDQWVNHQKMSESDADIGDFLGTGIPGLGIAAAQWFMDNSNGRNHLRALVSTELVTTLMKTGFGRNRPGSSNNHRSFPSGHTSTVFASATSLTYAYGWKAAALAFPLAVFTGASRLADDAHWFSDVVAGAFVGIWWGRASYQVVNEKPNLINSTDANIEKQIENKNNFICWPQLEKGWVGVAASYDF